MKIQSDLLENHQVKLTVEVEAERLEDAKRRGARKLSGKAKIAGFRPGKAPYNVILRNYGEAAILEEALDILVGEVYPDAIEESKIKPYGPGKLDKVSSMEPLVLEFVIPLDAEVDLGDYKSIRKAYELPQITDKEVQQVLESLRERQAILEPVERPAEEGDLVSVQLSAARQPETETAEEDSEDLTLIRERSIQVVIKSEAQTGDKDDVEWPFDGFSRKLISLETGQELAFEYSYPEDSEYESLRNSKANFALKIESVKSRTLPELNDEFAASVGEYESMDALLSDVRSGLEKQAEQEYNDKYDSENLETAVAQATFKYPPEMLEDQINEVIRELSRRLENQGMDMDLYLKTRSMEMEALKEEAKPAAESRLKRSLFLYHLAELEKIQINPEELQEESLSTINYLSSTLPEQEARKLGDEKVYRNLISNIMADMITRKSIERFRAICSGKAEEIQENAQIEESEPVEVEAVENVQSSEDDLTESAAGAE